MTWAGKALPPVRYGSIVCGFHSQSVAPAHRELYPCCHSNDPSAVNTVQF